MFCHFYLIVFALFVLSNWKAPLWFSNKRAGSVARWIRGVVIALSLIIHVVTWWTATPRQFDIMWAENLNSSATSVSRRDLSQPVGPRPRQSFAFRLRRLFFTKGRITFCQYSDPFLLNISIYVLMVLHSDVLVFAPIFQMCQFQLHRCATCQPVTWTHHTPLAQSGKWAQNVKCSFLLF